MRELECLWSLIFLLAPTFHESFLWGCKLPQSYPVCYLYYVCFYSRNDTCAAYCYVNLYQNHQHLLMTSGLWQMSSSSTRNECEGGPHFADSVRNYVTISDVTPTASAWSCMPLSFCHLLALVSGGWHLTQWAAGMLVISAGMDMWDSFQESDRPITRSCSGSDRPQTSRHASAKRRVVGTSVRVLKPSNPLLRSVQAISTLLEPV